MLISFLLTNLPPVLLIVGGIIASLGALHIAVSVPGTRRPSDKGGVAVALGLAIVLVMIAWNSFLDIGFRFLGVAPDAAITAQERGDSLGELGVAGQIVMITAGAVAVLTLVLALIIGAIQRSVLARPSAAAPAGPSGYHPYAAPTEGSGHEPPLS